MNDLYLEANLDLTTYLGLVNDTTGQLFKVQQALKVIKGHIEQEDFFPKNFQ